MAGGDASARSLFVFINGSFGIRKSSVTRALCARLDRAGVLDPEKLGFLLQCLPWNYKRDYQELRSWRILTVLGARFTGRLRRVVFIPMAFSDLTILDEIRAGVGHRGNPTMHFCLTAPLSVVRERLSSRGEPMGDPRWEWAHRRAEECCIAHVRPEFGAHVPTQHRSVDEIAGEIVELMQERA